jgi:MoaA/NifB/PqqE/SkfB family radical SAM enzyme
MLSNPNFSTITYERCKNVSYDSKIIWLQFFITGSCNMSCHYCKRFGKFEKDITVKEFETQCNILSERKIQKIKLTGGEPTSHKDIVQLIKISKNNAEQVSIGTNGTASELLYNSMIDNGLSSMTISFDGKHHTHSLKVISSIKNKLRIVAGITIDETNINDIQNIVDMALSAGCNDCSISISTNSKFLDTNKLNKLNTYNLPILTFRTKQAILGTTRGASNKKCYMCLDSLCIKNGKHYPCQIYMRENGNEIGEVDSLYELNKKRLEWSDTHDCSKDLICTKYCPDFCREFNCECQKSPKSLA